MHTNPALRILLDAAVVACIIFGWWYAALPLAILSAWVLPFYVELPLEGLFFDALYGADRGLGLLGHIGLIVALIAGGIMILLKAVMKM